MYNRRPDVAAAVARLSVVFWRGHVWRGHSRRYAGDDPGGSLRVSGRWHRGGDQFPLEQSWPVLYTTLERDTYVLEMLRHLPWDDPQEAKLKIKSLRRSRLLIELSRVVDCRDPRLMGLTETDLCHDTDYHLTQAIGAAALASGAEGILVPSVTRTGDNLIIFTSQLQADSRVVVVETLDPYI